ncbi:hypothetical protein HMPREF9176_1831 [Streptococcus downei F0415]|nr:hypothetical protein HMPREF9176_1831 [Streptococcus downei F0415]
MPAVFLLEKVRNISYFLAWGRSQFLRANDKQVTPNCKKA